MNAHDLATSLTAALTQLRSSEPKYTEMLKQISSTYSTKNHLQTRDKHEIKFLIAMATNEAGEWIQESSMKKELKRQIVLFYYVVTGNWSIATANIRAYDNDQLNLPPLVPSPSGQTNWMYPTYRRGYGRRNYSHGGVIKNKIIFNK